MAVRAHRRGWRDGGVAALLGAAVAAALLAAPAPARAEPEVLLKRAVFREEGGVVTATVGFRELFDRELTARLRSGFATTVVMRVYLYDRHAERVVGFSARTLRAVYDLWEERYLLTVEEPGRAVHRRLKARRAVVDRLTSLWHFPVARAAGLRPGAQYFVAVIAEVNPISEELLAEVRRWLRNPQGARRQMGGESFFGSFVSVFVNNKIRRAEKTLRLRTETFFRRPRPPRAVPRPRRGPRP